MLEWVASFYCNRNIYIADWDNVIVAFGTNKLISHGYLLYIHVLHKSFQLYLIIVFGGALIGQNGAGYKIGEKRVFNKKWVKKHQCSFACAAIKSNK